MKIGIITMHNVPNYGSHLQAYALQKQIEKMGNAAELINYKYPNKFHLMEMKKSSTRKIKFVIKRIFFFPVYVFYKIVFVKQSLLFKEFERKYFNLSKEYNSQESLQSTSLDYDVYLTGSDQVWNPRFACGDSIFMCNFGCESVPRIAFGASIAAIGISEKLQNMYKEYLAKYSAIGIRDISSKDFLETLLGKTIDVVCDPVFLLEKTEWEELAFHSSLKLPEKYILVYILTYSFNPYPEIVDIIKRVKDKLQIPVVFLSASLRYCFQIEANKNIFTASVFDFLYLFSNASYIITSSFHGTAFSLIFNKQFVSIVNGSNKDSRIRDLLDQLDVNQYCCMEDFNMNIVDQKIDYEKTNSALSFYREKSLLFLNNNLHSCN